MKGLIAKLLVSIAIISAYLTTTSFFDNIASAPPVHTIIISFATCGLLLIALGYHCPALFKTSYSHGEHNRPTLPLQTQKPNGDSHKSSSHLRIRNRPVITVTTTESRLILLGAILALALRVELYRRIQKASQCTANSPEVYIPAIVAAWDAGCNIDLDVDLDITLGNAWRRLLGHRFRFIPSTFIMSFGCFLLLGIWNATPSTYICPLSGGQSTIIPMLQIAASVLDALLLIVVVEMSLPNYQVCLPYRLKGTNIWALVLIVTAIVWLIIGTVIHLAVPDDLSERLPFDVIFSIPFIGSQITQALLISILYITAITSSLHFGLTYTASSLTAILVLVPSLQFIWTNRAPFVLVSPTVAMFAFLLIYLGWRTFEFARQCLQMEKRHSVRRQLTILLIFLVATYPCWSSSTTVRTHPIDILIEKANVQHREYLESVKVGNSLQDAVVEYKRRYSMRPPPGFDIWYEHATNTSATIIDEFNQIHHDLLPFRMISPADLRRQTWEMVSNPWNGISGITIRNGTAKVQDNVIPTHRWMVEGVEHLIRPFAQYLPDMDLAFNLNDESRVAVPHAEISLLRSQARRVELLGSHLWSNNRSEGWLPIPEEGYNKSVFTEASLLNSFSQYGSVACDPQSPARRYTHSKWPPSHLCLDCIKPHSEGQFVSDWSLAADVCHQPDLAHLQGFYLSPAAFKTSHKLMPVFSQSKPHGFHDILYPSAWNYRDKVMYDPSKAFPDPDFASKENTLFWRGATSEGVSRGNHVWEGMTRQRLVHMTNNLTDSRHDYATILVPSGPNYKYKSIAGPSIKNLGLSTNISFVDNVVRCGGIDCDEQKAEFGFAQGTNFQSHWHYRYLFDLDGAGFSGRFLPFLQSKSLPFKTALFREWYDSRLTAWKHFVPQDIRLHGVWSTLAYFSGVEEVVGRRKVRTAPHMDEGEKIASAGREWAGKVLRKEDMELYFWRLLLEWGRLTDDNRDELGFSI